MIHVIFVPLIWWASLILLRTAVAKFSSDSLGLIATFTIYIFYAAYYLTLGDFLVAITYNVILTGIFMHCNTFYTTYPDAWVWALLAKALGWWVQIAIGHNRLEGRKPALFDSLFDAIVMAPLFTWYEVLFFLGFKRDFKQQLDAVVAKNILALNRTRKTD